MLVERCLNVDFIMPIFITGTTFNLKTRSGQTIVTEQLSIGSLALEKKDTKIIVHGWLESQNGPWITNLVNAFLDMVNFIIPLKVNGYTCRGSDSVFFICPIFPKKVNSYKKE